MNLDDLLKSIREEDDDSKGGKINADKLKSKTFKNPLVGQSFKAPGLPKERPVVVKIEPDKLIPKDDDSTKEVVEKLDELIKVIKADNELEKKEQDYDKKKDASEKRQKRERRIEVKKLITKSGSPSVLFIDTKYTCEPEALTEVCNGKGKSLTDSVSLN